MSIDDNDPAGCSIARVGRLRLSLTGAPWPFALAHRADIASHWEGRVAANPAFWDGEVLVLRELGWAGETLCGIASLERFSGFLYWRDHPWLDRSGLDGFGAAIVRSAEGHVLVGRAAAGTLNAGRIYLPGGFLDVRDVTTDGTIDVAACAARELAEEIGLDVAGLVRVPDVIVARHGRHCCFATEWRSPLPGEQLLRLLRKSMARDGDREMGDIDLVRAPGELASGDIIGHARFVIANILAGTV